MPKYDVTVRLTGKDGNVFVLAGLVGSALVKEVSRDAADEFYNRVFASGSYEEALTVMRETVNVE